MTGTIVVTVIFILALIGLYQVGVCVAEPVVNFCLGFGRLVIYPIVWVCNGRESAEHIRKDHKRWVIDLKN